MINKENMKEIVLFAEEVCLKPLGIESLRENQKEFLQNLAENKRCVVAWDRQTGGSTMLLIYALWLFLVEQKGDIIFVSPSIKDCSILHKKALSILRDFFDEERFQKIFKKIDSYSITMMKGKSLSFLNDVCGNTFTSIIVDEFRRCDYERLLSMLPLCDDCSRQVFGSSNKPWSSEILWGYFVGRSVFAQPVINMKNDNEL